MRTPWVATLALTLLLTACATATPGATPAASAPTLEGTSWVVTHIEGAQTIAEKQPTIAFADGKVGGNASCNQYGTSFTQTDAKLELGREVAMTAMACTDAKLTAQEDAFAKALGTVTGVRGTAEAAELLNAGGTVALTLAPAPTVTPKPLVGTTWSLTGVVENEAVTSTVADTKVTLTFTDDALSGTACNTFRGSVTVDGSTLKVGPIASTRKACVNADEGKQESTVLGILEDATGYSIEGDVLTLTAPDKKGLVFAAS